MSSLTDLSLLVLILDKTAADNMTPIELSSIVLTLPPPNKMQDPSDIEDLEGFRVMSERSCILLGGGR